METARCKDCFHLQKHKEVTAVFFSSALKLSIRVENPSNNELKSNKMGAYKGQQTYLFKTSCCPQNRLRNIASFLLSTASVFEASTADIFLCNFGMTFT